MSKGALVRAAFAAALVAAAPGAMAQPASPPTPTTRILAIGTIQPGADLQQVRRILPGEMQATAELYLQGKIDQWYSLQGRLSWCRLHPQCHRSRDGQGDAGGAAAWPRTPDEFRTRSSGSAYPLAPTAPGTPTIEGA